MHFLYNYTDVTIIVIMGVGAAACCALMPIAFNRFLPHEQGKDIDLVMRAMTTTAAILTLVLGFSIVQAKSDLFRVQEAINVEARALGELDRLMLRFDPPKTAPARETLARYINAIVTEEWPLLKQRSGSAKAAGLVRQLARQIEELEPQPGKQQSLFPELVRNVATVEHRRDDRIFTADNTRLPTLFWVVILFLFVALAFTSAFLKPTKIAVVLLAAQAAMFGMLTAFLFILDEPFLGQTSASPQPFVRVYAKLSEAQTTGTLSSPDANADDEEGDQ